MLIVAVILASILTASCGKDRHIQDASGSPDNNTMKFDTISRTAVPRGTLAFTEGQLKLTFVGKQYARSDIVSKYHPSVEIFYDDGRYQYVGANGSIQGSYDIHGQWLCVVVESKPSVTSHCTQAFRQRIGEIMYASPISDGRMIPRNETDRSY